jgi:Integrase core domain/Chromo (CHRromatin Organisation MOdifier) domain
VVGSYEGPMKRISMDTVGPFPEDESGFKYVIVIICNFSRYVTLWPVKGTSGVEAAQILIQHVADKGTPVHVHYDGGTQFKNELAEEVRRLMGVTSHLSTPYSHEENGVVERSIKEFLHHMRNFLFKGQLVGDWRISVPIIQRIMNAAYHSRLGCSPASLVYGNTIDLDRYIVHGPKEEEAEELSVWHQNLVRQQNKLILRVQEFLKKTDAESLAVREALQGQKKRMTYKNGEYVLVKYLDSRPPTKLHSPWKGPYRVVGCTDDIVSIQDIRMRLGGIRSVHITAVKRFEFDPTRVDPVQVAMRDHDQYQVERIINHKPRKPIRRTTLQFETKWLGYDETTWEPWELMRNNVMVHKYLHGINKDIWIPIEWRRDNYDTEQEGDI